MGPILSTCVNLAIGIAIFLATSEIALRLAPWAIPPMLLIHFEPGLRSELAEGRFSTRKDTVPVKRDDDGPPLWIWKPFARKLYSFDDHGAVLEAKADEHGFCNPPGAGDATAAVDVVALGDSFTWCHAVRPEDAWALRIAKLTGLSSYNLGRGGMGLYEYVQFLKLFGLARSPKVVVMNVYEGNDLRDAVRYYEFRSGSGTRPPPEGPGEASGGGRSYTANLLRAIWRETVGTWSRSRAKQDVDYRFHVAGADGEITFNSGQGSRDEVLTAQKARAGEIGFELLDEALEAFTALAREHDFVPIVAYSPSAAVVYGADVRFEDPTLAELLPWFSEAQRRYFADKARELDFLFVDMTPNLSAAISRIDETSLLYYPSSIHLTAKGHDVVARTLAAVVRDATGGAP